MKYLMIACCFTVLMAQAAFGQTQTFLAVAFLDSNTAVAVGIGGAMARSTDKGNTWNLQNSGTTATLTSITPAGLGKGFVAGNLSNTGYVFSSQNSGGSWSTASTLAMGIQGISFANQSTGSVAGSGGAISHSTDGGASWAAQTSGTANNFYGISFADASNGVAVGWGGQIVRTGNGGSTWSTVSTGNFNQLYAVQNNSSVATAVGLNSTILRSVNGGSSWSVLANPAPSTTTWRGVYFWDANNGVVVGQSGMIIRTANGGGSWTLQAPYAVTLYGAAFLNGSIGVIVGEQGIILRTTNGGSSWTKQTIGGAPSMSVSVNSASVCSGSSATLVATVSGGTSPYTYSWNTGAATSSISVTTAGTYSVTVTDSKGVTASGSGTLTVTTPPTVSVNSIALCSGTAGTLTASASGGTSPYTYLWGNGATTSSISVAAGGTYNVTVTDSKGCSGSGSGVVTINTPPTVSVNSPTVCGGSGTLTASVTGGTAPYSYLWNTGVTTSSITASVAGVYSVTVTDSKGCSGTGSGTLTINVPPVVSVNSAAVCGGTSATLTATVTGGVAPFTYSWNTGATTSSVSASTAGTYTVTVTDSKGCTGTGSGVLTVNTPPAVTVNSTAICSGTTATLSALVSGGTSPYTYLWNTGATTSSITTSTAGSYTVTVTDSKGCTGSGSGSVVVNLTPSVAVNSIAVCSGTNGTLTATPTGGTSPYTYSWNTGATTPSISVSTAGTYTVTVTDSKGCSQSASGTLTVNTPPSVTVGVSGTVCSGSATLTATPTGGTSPYTFLWNTGATTQSISTTIAGTYSVTVTDSKGCTGSSSGSVPACSQVLPTVTTTAASAVSSSGGTMNGNVNPNGGATSAWFEWGTSSTLATFTATTSQSIGSGTSAVAISAPLTALNPNTIYYYRAAAQNSAGTQKDGILSFTTGAVLPTVTTTAASAVTQTTATLNGSVNPNGAATSIWFEWGTSNTLATFTATTAQSIGSGTSVVSVSANIAGLTANSTYYFRVVGQNSAGTQKDGILSFSTPSAVQQLPTVTTTAASAVSSSGGTMNGNVNPNGGATSAWFEWGTSSTLATFTATTSQSIGSGTSAVAISAPLTALNPNTIYYYRAAAQNSAGTQKDGILSFTTGAVLPTVTTTAASAVSSSGGTMNGTVNPNGAATTGWFEWGTSNTLATFTATVAQSLGSGSSVVALSAPLTGLSPNTVYYYRAAGQNSAGTQKDGILSFTTGAVLPTVTTTAASAVSSSGGTMNGTVNPNGAATTGWFEWGTSNTLATFTATVAQSLGSGSSVVALSAPLTGLSPNTVYYYRAAGQNSAGTQKDGILSFTTGAVLPTVVTTAASAVTSGGATMNGTVNPNGAATNGWFEWGTSSTLSTFSSTPIQSMGSGTSVAALTANVTGLSANTVYYFRAVGQNSAGTQKDGILSFTTPATPPYVKTIAASSVTSNGGTMNASDNPNGSATSAWFEWGTSSTLSSFASTATQALGSGNSLMNVSAGLSGLNPKTVYYYRAAAQNSAGTQKDVILSFTTGAVLPTVATGAASSVTFDAGTLNGSVNPNGDATSAWFEWGTSSTLSTYTSTALQSVGSGTSASTITSALTGLTGSTTYYYRAVAQNSAGTQRDVILSFTTTSSAPSFAVSPLNLSFGNVLVGTTKKDSLTVTNSGGSTLTVSRIKSSNVKFTVSPTSLSVPAGGSAKVYVTFNAAQKKIFTARIIFTFNATGSPDTVLVSGQGVSTLAATATINFGSVSVGSSKNDSFSLVNDGDVLVPVTSVISTNPVFTVNPTTATIPANDSLWFYVVAQPTAPATEEGLVIVSYGNGLPPDTFFVRTDGVTGVIIEKLSTPREYALQPNYPNPFNPTTTIQYDLPEASSVDLIIYTLTGQEVTRLVTGEMGSGHHYAVWNGQNRSGEQMGSGIYIYRLKAVATGSGKEFSQTRRMTLLK